MRTSLSLEKDTPPHEIMRWVRCMGAVWRFFILLGWDERWDGTGIFQML